MPIFQPFLRKAFRKRDLPVFPARETKSPCGLNACGMSLLSKRASGAGLLLFFILLAPLAASLLLIYEKDRKYEATLAKLDHSGSTLLDWLKNTHYFAQENIADLDALDSVEDDVKFLSLSQEQLINTDFAPPWYADANPDNQIAMGVIDDGNGVPMAVAILRNDSLSFENTPIDFYLRAAQSASEIRNTPANIVGYSLGRLTDNQLVAIESILSDNLRNGDIITTAADHINYDTRVFHRRPQPGHPELTTAGADIDFAGHSLTAESISAEKSEQSGTVTTPLFIAEDNLNARSGLDAITATLTSFEARNLTLTTNIDLVDLNVGKLTTAYINVKEEVSGTDLNSSFYLDADNISVQRVTTNTSRNDNTIAEILHKGENDRLETTQDNISATIIYSPTGTIEETLTVQERCLGC